MSREVSIILARLFGETPLLLDRLRRERFIGGLEVFPTSLCPFVPLRSPVETSLLTRPAPASLRVVACLEPPTMRLHLLGLLLSCMRMLRAVILGAWWTASFMHAYWAVSPWMGDRLARWAPIAGLLCDTADTFASGRSEELPVGENVDCVRRAASEEVRGAEAAVQRSMARKRWCWARKERRADDERTMHHTLRMAAWSTGLANWR